MADSPAAGVLRVAAVRSFARRSAVFSLLSLLLSSSDRLRLRVARHAARADLQGLADAFEAVASQMGVSLAVESRSVNIVDDHRALPHERFALRRIPAATLTARTDGRKTPDFWNPEIAPYLEGSVFSAPLNATRLCLHVQLIAEALARFSFGVADAGLVIPAGSCEVDFFAGIGGGSGVCGSLAAQSGVDAAPRAVFPAGVAAGGAGRGDAGECDADERFKRGNRPEGGGEGVRGQRGRSGGVRGEVAAVRCVHVRCGGGVLGGAVRDCDDDAWSWGVVR